MGDRGVEVACSCCSTGKTTLNPGILLIIGKNEKSGDDEQQIRSRGDRDNREQRQDRPRWSLAKTKLSSLIASIRLGA